MKIKIDTLKLVNFKGIQHLEVNFDDSTTIAGDNGTGKTTVFDAFTWLLFGKDSQDSQNFNVKTLNADGTPIHKLDHEVEGVLNVDGQQMKLRRCLREKWVTRRGSSDAEFSGHETTFFIDDVPLQAGEYQDKIAAIIPESNFKLVTNPAYFNVKMKWTDRRDMLTSIAGQVTKAQIAGSDKELIELVDMMDIQKKTDEDLKKEYAAKKKLIKKELDGIPSRIDEVTRTNGNGNGEEINVKELTEQLKEIDAQLTSVRSSYDKQKEAVKERKRKASMIESAIIEREKVLENEHRLTHGKITDQVGELRNQFKSVNDRKDFLEDEIKEQEKSVEYLKGEVAKLRKEWFSVNEQKFTLNGELKCPTCLQDLPNIAERKTELLQNFNTNKVSQLAQISEKGKSYGERMDAIKVRIDEAKAEVEQHKAKMLKLNGEIGELSDKADKAPKVVQVLVADQILKDLESQLKEVEKNIVSIPDDKAAQDLEQQRSEIVAALERNKEREAAKAAKMQRLDELQKQEKSLSEQLADLEQFEFVIARYQTNKINMIESKVNSLFNLVTFRMFDQQINGGEKPTCETLINGVPYSDANHAAQINAGIDIINTFSQHLELNAPIWVDNAEAVNVLTETKSQIIKLLVSKDKKILIK